MPYLGNEPAVAYTSTTKDTFSGDGSTTDFTMSKSANVNAVRVVVENVVQNPTVAYTCSGTTIAFTSAPPTGTSNIYVVHLGPPAATIAPPTTINNSTTFGDGADIITASKGTDNVRIGDGAGASIASGGNDNTLMGKDAGTAITTGERNTILGSKAGDAATTIDDAVLIGYNAGGGATMTGHDNIGVGASALAAATTGSQNIAVGKNSGAAVTTGEFNVLMGHNSGLNLTDADYNVAIGGNALDADTKGSRSVAIGTGALGVQNFTSSTDSNNIAIGYAAGAAVLTGIRETLIGSEAGDAITTGNDNTAVGALALSAEVAGHYSTAVGRGALKLQTNSSSADAHNVAVGYSAGEDTTDGARNTFIGSLAGTNANADDSVCVGYNAGGGATMTGHDNVLVGKDAGESLTSGGQNTYIGKDCATSAANGGANVIIGFQAGTSTTALTSGGTNTLIGSYTHASTVDASSAVGLGHSLSCATGYATIGHGGSDIRAAHGNTTWSTVSDERYKKDIVDSTAGLSFINDLQPKTFKYKNLGELPDTFSSYEEGSTDVFKSDKTQHGFIAQEVKTAIEAHSEIKDGFMLWDSRDDGSQEIAETALIPILTKAVQELSAKNDALETENTAIKARLDALEAG